jgi:hypothetical protein
LFGQPEPKYVQWQDATAKKDCSLIVSQLGKRNKIVFAGIAGMSYNLVLRWS